MRSNTALILLFMIINFTMVSSLLGRSSCRTFPRVVGQQHKMNTRRLQTFMYSSSTAKYQKSYKLDGIGEGTKVEITTNTGHSLMTDIPKPMGGKDTAPQPVETLLASWMGCTQATALFVGRHLPGRLVIGRMEFDSIEGFRDERGALELPINATSDVPSRLQRITGTIRVYERKGNPISAEQMELLKEQTEIRCPVANMMIASGCAIDVEWVDGGSSA